MKILMVCLGNICRSPMAEGILKDLAEKEGLDWQIESAGTNSFHTGEAPHPSSQKVCLKHGIDISSQKARTFKSTDMKHFDMIYALANDVMLDIKRMAGHTFDGSKVDLLLNELYPNENRSVTDPWYGNDDGYLPVFQEIQLCCEAIIKKYKKAS